jgi:hypothetical protein
MQVSYERTGGFAGMRIAASFDVDQLPEQDSKSIRDLIDKSDFVKLPAKILGPTPVPDQFTYEITVTADTWKHTVITGDASAPENLRPLIDLLSQLARTRGRA